MNPLIKYYGVFQRVYKPGLQTPKYELVGCAGCYPPMGEIIGKEGKVYLYLKKSNDCGSFKRSVPPLRLQAKGSLNFTGLKFLYTDGAKLGLYAYGNPPQTPTFGKMKKVNPFYAYRKDGFLFVIHQNDQAEAPEDKLIPFAIELLVLDGAGKIIPTFCKQMELGGFNDELSNFRNLLTPKKTIL